MDRPPGGVTRKSQSAHPGQEHPRAGRGESKHQQGTGPYAATYSPLGKKGTPSHDTFNRVLNALHWHDFEAAVRAWTLRFLRFLTSGKIHIARPAERY